MQLKKKSISCIQKLKIKIHELEIKMSIYIYIYITHMYQNQKVNHIQSNIEILISCNQNPKSI